jgi:hypothetical protein
MVTELNTHESNLPKITGHHTVNLYPRIIVKLYAFIYECIKSVHVIIPVSLWFSFTYSYALQLIEKSNTLIAFEEESDQ